VSSTGMVFKAEPEMIAALELAGVDVVSPHQSQTQRPGIARGGVLWIGWPATRSPRWEPGNGGGSPCRGGDRAPMLRLRFPGVTPY